MATASAARIVRDRLFPPLVKLLLTSNTLERRIFRRCSATLPLWNAAIREGGAALATYVKSAALVGVTEPVASTSSSGRTSCVADLGVDLVHGDLIAKSVSAAAVTRMIDPSLGRRARAA
jgi:hypothetical protein